MERAPPFGEFGLDSEPVFVNCRHVYDERKHGAGFLERLATGRCSASPLIDDAEGFGAALRFDPDGLAAALSEDARRAPAGPLFVVPSRFHAAALDRQGQVIAATSGIPSDFGPRNGRELVACLCPDRPVLTQIIDGAGQAHPAVVATPDRARAWPVAADLAGSARAVAIVVLHASDGPGDAAARLGLSKLQRRVTDGLARHGEMRRVAAHLGVPYETAREAAKIAMRKAGVSTQAALVSTWLSLQAGEGAGGVRHRLVLQDLNGLSERQARIAVLVGEGMTRDEAAARLGLSAHVVKAELKIVFVACEVDSVAALAALVARVRALTALAQATDVGTTLRAGEPLRLIARAGGGRIAVVDHGPVGGLPVLILHTATTSRHQPASWIAAMQARGLRLIALDRPGFGLSDMPEGDYLDASAADLRRIMEALGLKQVCVLARGGTPVLARFAARWPDGLIRAVVVNPEPAPVADRRLEGMNGQVKRLVFGHPGLIERLAGHLSRRASASVVEALVRRSLDASPADRATLSDPGFVADYVRATQLCALQRGAGFIAVARDEPRADNPVSDGANITLVCGDQDPLYDPADSLPRWQGVWPGCRTVIASGAGRLLIWQRPDLIADLLLGA